MATRNQSAIDWRYVLLGGGILLVIFVLAAIDAIADGIRNLMVSAGVPAGIAGEFGSMVFAGLGLLIFVVLPLWAYSKS